MKKSKVGVRQAVFCATLGLTPYVLAGIFSGSYENTIEVLFGLVREAGFEIASGLIALYAAAVIFGGYAGALIERHVQNNRLLCYITGIGLALGCALAALLAGAFCALLREVIAGDPELAGQHAVQYLVIVPAYIMLYAALPAAVLGMLYTILVIRAVRRSPSTDSQPARSRIN